MTDYVVPRTTYTLQFTDPEHTGMVVKVRAMSMAEALSTFDLVWQPEDDLPTRKAKQEQSHQMFVEHLVEWNLHEENGDPVPLTLDGLHSLEPDFVGLLVGTWKVGRQKVPAPLDKPSGSGVSPPEVESTLTEIPSESLAS